MRKDVQVSVLGILDAGGGPEAVLTRTTGICSPQGGGYQVSYREVDEHGMPRTISCSCHKQR